MKVFKVKVKLVPLVKVTGLSALHATEVDDIITQMDNEFCINHSVRTKDEYIGYGRNIHIVRCNDEKGKTIDNSRG